jgi:hypothetical protein
MVAERQILRQRVEFFMIAPLLRFWNISKLFSGFQSDVEVYRSICPDPENRSCRFIPPYYGDRWDEDGILLKAPRSDSG